MKIARMETQTTEVEVVEDILCNLCGETCQKKYGPGFYGLIEHTVRGGYASDPLEDCTNYTFSLCEVCLAWIFDRCKVPVQTGGYWASEPDCGTGEAAAWSPKNPIGRGDG